MRCHKKAMSALAQLLLVAGALLIVITIAPPVKAALLEVIRAFV